MGRRRHARSLEGYRAMAGPPSPRASSAPPPPRAAAGVGFFAGGVLLSRRANATRAYAAQPDVTIDPAAARGGEDGGRRRRAPASTSRWRRTSSSTAPSRRRSPRWPEGATASLVVLDISCGRLADVRRCGARLRGRRRDAEDDVARRGGREALGPYVRAVQRRGRAGGSSRTTLDAPRRRRRRARIAQQFKPTKARRSPPPAPMPPARRACYARPHSCAAAGPAAPPSR